MHKFPPIVAMLFLAACDVPVQWQKPEVERAALDSDLLQCRHTGQQQSLRAYASQLNFPFNSPPFWAGSWQPSRDRWNRSVEADREYAEGRYTADCMREKGYERTSSRPPGKA